MKFRELLEASTAEFRVGLGKLKQLYGNDEVPTEKTLISDAKIVIKNGKIKNSEEFIKYVLKNIKFK